MDTTTNTYPRIRNYDKPSKVLSTPCGRCGGNGIFSQFHGTCYRCGGNGIDPTYKDWGFPVEWTDGQCAEWDDKRNARNETNRVKAQAKRQAKADTTLDANVARFPVITDVRDWDQDIVPAMPYFLQDIASKARLYELSDGQGEALVKGWTEYQAKIATYDDDKAAEDAAKGTIVAGLHTMEGVVLATKWKESQFGSTLKMLVEVEAEDGIVKVWGTVPSALQGDWDDAGTWAEGMDKGDTIRFTAEVVPSDDDRAFGFFSKVKRAKDTKAVIVKRAEETV